MKMWKRCKGCKRWFNGLPSEDYCDDCIPNDDYKDYLEEDLEYSDDWEEDITPKR